MIHIVVTTGDSYNWRFVIDPLDRNIDVTVPNLDEADVEFALSLIAQISAWKCKKAGITRHMLNSSGLVDVCPGEPDIHIQEISLHLASIFRFLLIDWKDIECKLPSMTSK